MIIQKISHTEFKEALEKSPLECSENELRFIFNALGFDLKEFKQETSRVVFEVHFRRNYIVKVELVSGLLVFSNRWIIFNDKNETERHNINFQFNGSTIKILNLFLDMFGPCLLNPLQYMPAYIKGWSVCDSPKETKEYWDILSEVGRAQLAKDASKNKLTN